MTIHHATVYRKDTGQILSSGFFSCEEDLVEINFAVRLNAAGGRDHDLIDVPADPDRHYVALVGGDAWGRGEPTVRERPPIPYEIDKTTLVANGEDYLTITELHDPCTIVVDDPDPTTETSVHTVRGGGFEFAADTPGVYTLEISRFPFLPMKLEITAL